MLSFVIREWQAKIIARYHYTPIGMPRIQKTKLVRMWSNRNFHSLLNALGTQNDIALLEDSLAVSYRVKHSLTILSNNHASRDLSN